MACKRPGCAVCLVTVASMLGIEDMTCVQFRLLKKKELIVIVEQEEVELEKKIYIIILFFFLNKYINTSVLSDKAILN